MQIRDSVRRRRQERIMQLLARRPDEPQLGIVDRQGEFNVEIDNTRQRDEPRPEVSSRQASAPAVRAEPEPDPELWWKEQQKRLNRTQPVWQGASGFAAPPAAPPGHVARGSAWSRFAAGFAVRVAVAAVLYSAAYLWFQSDLPGNQAARSWTANAVTHDMDFQAVEAWYETYFGGSPSFLPVFRSNRTDAEAVSGEWKRSEALPPAAGRIVQTFRQDGSGIRIAADAGSEVRAAYAGRVKSVVSEEDGRATIVIQHAGRMTTLYGNVAQPAVRTDDWVQAGQRVGTVPAPKDEGGKSLLYFSVKQSDQAVDPLEVVPFD